MIDFILQPWPWWLSGILIGLTVPMLYILSGKAFGISTSLRHIGAACTPNARWEYVGGHNWRSGSWNLVFIGGIVVGGFVGAQLLSAEPLALLPAAYYTAPGLARLAIGGVLVGFGTRYAGGCTSGHSITGLSNLNWPSLVATIFFFVGGLIVTWGFGSLLLPSIG